jgi:putative hydrolase of the HAD superfamily
MTDSLEAVCFDLDDTLYDYERYARAGLDAAADRLASLTGRRYHEAFRRIYFEEGVTDGTFDVCLDRYDVRERHDLDADVVGELVDAFHGAETPLEPYPETEAVLSALDDRFALGLITDGRGGHAKLRRLGLADRFDEVLVTPTVGRSKRERAVFEHVLFRLSTPADAAVYVGDDPRIDFRVPNAMSMTTVRLRRGRYADLEPGSDAAAPDSEIASLDELPTLLADRPPVAARQRRADGGDDAG